jgi:glycosyltransferase involved in cell wall biosynthesis
MNVPRPDVTVVIPTRDRLSTLPATLAGVWRQCNVCFEVVLVDDGSEPDVAADYERLRSERLRVLRNATPRGPAAARNAGIAAARGHWIAFLDDDDLWAPTKLRSQLDAAKQAGAGWAWCGAAYLSSDGAVLSIAAGPSPEDVRRQLPSGSVIPAGASNVIASAELLRRVGGFDPAIFHMPDWDLWLRLLLADPGAAHPEPLVGYVQHPGMLSHRQTTVLDRDLAIIDRKLREQGLRPADAAVRRGLLEWMAQGHIAAGRWHPAARIYARSGLRYRRVEDLARALGALGRSRGSRMADRVVRRLAPSQVETPAERPRWLDEYVEFPQAPARRWAPR